MKTFNFIIFICLLIANLSKAQVAENVNLLFTWNEDTLVGSAAYNNIYNEIWGVVVDNREYAIIGSTYGTHFFDVTNPEFSFEVAVVKGRVIGSQIIHRDYHDYNGYLYAVCDEGVSSLQIIDISTLPDSVSLVYDSSELFERAHNIFIDTLNAKLYTTNGDIYSLENPVDPKLIYSTQLLNCHDIYVQNDTAYINAGSQGFIVIDFSQTSLENQTHEVLGVLASYVDQGYNHSGWITDDGNYYVMADETWGMKMKMLDISDFSNIQVIALIGSNVDVNSIPHNQIINGNYLYTAYYHDGLYVHEISNPYSPLLIGYFDTFEPNHHNSYMGAWGVYPFLPSGNILLSDMQTGLYVFEVNYNNPLKTIENHIERYNVYPNPSHEILNIELPNESKIEMFNIQGERVYVSMNIKNLQIKTNNFINGIYILKITNKLGVSVQKIIIE
tara:strand:- start:108 stop:1439 length:1332 start_codon:yes stop_codon:yes gene_type:complete